MNTTMKILSPPPPNWEAIEAVGTRIAAIGTLAAVYLALLLARRDVRARRIERRGEITAMLVEVLRARISMQALLQEEIQAPLYRLPITNFHRALPKIIADGQLDGNEIDLLVEYENRVEELNRGLERAGDAARKDAQVLGIVRLINEFSRNRRRRGRFLRKSRHGLVTEC